MDTACSIVRARARPFVVAWKGRLWLRYENKPVNNLHELTLRGRGGVVLCLSPLHRESVSSCSVRVRAELRIRNGTAAGRTAGVLKAQLTVGKCYTEDDSCSSRGVTELPNSHSTLRLGGMRVHVSIGGLCLPTWAPHRSLRVLRLTTCYNTRKTLNNSIMLQAGSP